MGVLGRPLILFMHSRHYFTTVLATLYFSLLPHRAYPANTEARMDFQYPRKSSSRGSPTIYLKFGPCTPHPIAAECAQLPPMESEDRFELRTRKNPRVAVPEGFSSSLALAPWCVPILNPHRCLWPPPMKSEGEFELSLFENPKVRIAEWFLGLFMHSRNYRRWNMVARSDAFFALHMSFSFLSTMQTNSSESELTPQIVLLFYLERNLPF